MSFLEIEKEYQSDVDYYYTHAISHPFFKELACEFSAKGSVQNFCIKEKVSDVSESGMMTDNSICKKEGENSSPLVHIENYSLETFDVTVADSKNHGKCKAGQLEFIGYIEPSAGFSDCFDTSVVAIQSNEQNKTHTEQRELTDTPSLPLNIVDLCVVSLNIETEHKEQTMKNETTETHEFFKMADENKVSEQSNTSEQSDYYDEDSEDESSDGSCECDYCVPTRQEVFFRETKLTLHIFWCIFI